MSKPKVLLITEKLHPSAIELFESKPELFKLEFCESKDFQEKLAKAAICLLQSNFRIGREELDAATQLEVIGRPAIGYDNIDLDAANEHGVLVFNVPDANVNATAELSLALFFSLARHLSLAFSSMARAEWRRRECVGMELKDKTLCVIGFGQIGRSLALKAKALGMKVKAVDPYVEQEVFTEHGIEKIEFEEALPLADFLSLHVPLTSETRNMLKRSEFAKMKTSAYLINAARGSVVHESDLLEALNKGQIQGAALDVFETEPCTRLELLAHPRIISTPHLGSQTREAREAVGRGIAERLINYYEKAEIRSLVNPEALKRKGL